MRNNVVNMAATDIGSPNRANEWAMEFNPDVHVTIVDVRSGAFRK